MNGRAKSEIKIEKRKGPSTEPWGTPQMTGTKGVWSCPCFTDMTLFVRKDLKQSRTGPLSPTDTLRHWRRVSWSTQSNEAERPKKVAKVTLPLSKLEKVSGKNLRTAVSVEKLGDNLVEMVETWSQHKI